MPWTDEDTKDVLKKVLGGLIAASILAIIYAVLEDMPWYVAISLGLALVVLIVVAVWRLSRSEPVTGESATGSAYSGPREHPGELHRPEARSETAQVAEPLPGIDWATAPSSPAGDIPESEEKAVKKAVKAEQKRRKKEAKSQEKSSKR